MFNSIYAYPLSRYFDLRSTTLGDSARKHELCYLRRFDTFLQERLQTYGGITEPFVCDWIGSLKGKSSSIENEVIVVRQFLIYLRLSGERVFLPSVPKVYDDYVPYLFSDAELGAIFKSVDSLLQLGTKDHFLAIEFPVILRLLYSCGLRIGETVRIEMADVDLRNGILKMVNTKGDKHRLVPVSTGMADILRRYCMAMGLTGKHTGWLFPASSHEGHISDRSVKRQFEKILRKNHIQLEARKKNERGPCLHCLRHVFAIRSFAQAERQGRHLDDAIPFLSIYLGHDGINETEKYLKFSNELYPESIQVFGEYMSDLLPEVAYEE